MPNTTAPPVSFEDGAQALLDEIRAAFGAMTTALPGPVHRAIDVERALGVDKKLAWQVFRLANPVGLSELANVPPLASRKRLIAAARRRRVPQAVADRVSRVFDRFEEFAQLHSGDRDGLLSMVSALSEHQRDEFDLRVRKSLFRGHAHVWGVQARMAVRTGIFFPHPGTARVEDVALVVGDVDLMRRRQHDPLVMLWWLWTSEKPGGPGSPGVPIGAPDSTPISHGLEVMPDFCTQPLPEMHKRRNLDGTPETELVFPSGRSKAVTMYSFERRENVQNSPDASFFGQTLFSMPLETMVWEMLIPVGWSDPASARALIYGRRHHPEQVYEERTADLMAQRESLDYLGVHSGRDGVPPLDGDPTHAAAVRAAMERCGWSGTRFDVYRCRVEYPILYTMLVVRADAMKR